MEAGTCVVVRLDYRFSGDNTLVQRAPTPIGLRHCIVESPGSIGGGAIVSGISRNNSMAVLDTGALGTITVSKCKLWNVHINLWFLTMSTQFTPPARPPLPTVLVNC